MKDIRTNFTIYNGEDLEPELHHPQASFCVLRFGPCDIYFNNLEQYRIFCNKLNSLYVESKIKLARFGHEYLDAIFNRPEKSDLDIPLEETEGYLGQHEKREMGGKNGK